MTNWSIRRKHSSGRASHEGSPRSPADDPGSAPTALRYGVKQLLSLRSCFCFVPSAFYWDNNSRQLGVPARWPGTVGLCHFLWWATGWHHLDSSLHHHWTSTAITGTSVADVTRMFISGMMNAVLQQHFANTLVRFLVQVIPDGCDGNRNPSASMWWSGQTAS